MDQARLNGVFNCEGEGGMQDQYAERARSLIKTGRRGLGAIGGMLGRLIPDSIAEAVGNIGVPPEEKRQESDQQPWREEADEDIDDQDESVADGQSFSGIQQERTAPSGFEDRQPFGWESYRDQPPLKSATQQHDPRSSADSGWLDTALGLTEPQGVNPFDVDETQMTLNAPEALLEDSQQSSTETLQQQPSRETLSPLLDAHPVATPEGFKKAPGIDRDISKMSPPELTGHAARLESQWFTYRRELELARAEGKNYSRCETITLSLREFSDRIGQTESQITRLLEERETAAENALLEAIRAVETATHEHVTAFSKLSPRLIEDDRVEDKLEELKDEYRKAKRDRKRALRKARGTLARTRLENCDRWSEFHEKRINSRISSLVKIVTELQAKSLDFAGRILANIQEEIETERTAALQRAVDYASKRIAILQQYRSDLDVTRRVTEELLLETEGDLRRNEGVMGKIVLTLQDRLNGEIGPRIKKFDEQITSDEAERTVAEEEHSAYLLRVSASKSATEGKYESTQEDLNVAMHKEREAQTKKESLRALPHPIATPTDIEHYIE